MKRIETIIDTLRIGLLIPPPNVVMEPEFREILPQHITIHATRISRSTDKVTIDSLLEMERNTEEAARLLAMTQADVIIFGCTSGSFIRGVGWDKQIIEKIARVTPIPAITTSTAVIEALKALGIKKVAVLTPYIKGINEREKGFLEGNGFQVLKIAGLGISDAPKIAVVPMSEVYRLALQTNNKEADGLFISCTNFPTIGIIDRLERELDKPVVTSNQASAWYCLKRIERKELIKGFGSLFDK
jgi:maleate isomerase